MDSNSVVIFLWGENIQTMGFYRVSPRTVLPQIVWIHIVWIRTVCDYFGTKMHTVRGLTLRT